MHASFSELLVILIVALLVIKPKHLPEAAFKLGQGVKWIRHITAKIKEEIEGQK